MVRTFGVGWEIQSALCARQRCYTSFSGRAVGVILALADTAAIVTRLCFPRDIVLSLRQDVTEVSISVVHLNPSTSPDSLLALVRRLRHQ